MTKVRKALRPEVLLALGAVVAIAIAGWFWLRAAERELTEESSACLRCHSDLTEHLPGHDDLECRACHDAFSAGVPLAFVFAGPDDAELAEHGVLVGDDCRSCHEADEAGWRRQLQTSGHRAHLGEGITCVSCHRGGMHGGPLAPACADCHTDLDVHEDLGNGDCVTCHGFRAEDDPGVPEGSLLSEALLAIAPWTAQLDTDHVHGAGDCRSCHNPHQSAEAEADCVRCHRGVLAADVASGPEGHQECASCHAPHPPRDAPAVTCLECHRPPPPSERRRSGESLWAPVTSSDAGVAVDPSTLTHDARCGTCHTPHVFQADPTGCPACHEEMEAQIAHVSGHDACGQCHEPHSPPPGPGSCRECHRSIGHDGAPEAHRACLSCHEAHDGAPELESTCARCHSQVGISLAGGPPEHRACDTCHTPHGRPSRGSTAGCAHCHGAQARTATSAASPSAHRTCGSCHTAHDFARPPSCAGCHSDEARASATWPSGSAHSGPCAGCHQPHEAGRTPTCRSCHSEEANRSHTGSHRDCASCHEVHQAVPTSSSRWWGTCATCHADQARAGRAAPGDHAECKNCHSPVGQRPPRCASCHESITSTLQHQVRQHQRCVDCHRDHSVAPPRRDTCLGCHEAQARGHFPEADSCQSCHPFAR